MQNGCERKGGRGVRVRLSGGMARSYCVLLDKTISGEAPAWDRLSAANGSSVCYLSPCVGRSPPVAPVPRPCCSPGAAAEPTTELATKHHGKSSQYTEWNISAETPRLPRIRSQHHRSLHSPSPEREVAAMILDRKTFGSSLFAPSIESICRDTYQAMNNKRGKMGAALANRRHQTDVATRRKGRQKAAANRRSCEDRDKQEHEELKAQKKTEEEARRSEAEAALNRAKMRKIRWLIVMQRLNEDMPKRRASTVDPRIDVQRKAKLLHKRLEQRLQRKEARKLYFEALPLQRRRMLEDVFSLYDRDGSGSLQAHELYECLLEMGFRGHDPEERRAAVQICNHAVTNMQVQDDQPGSIDLHELAADVIPSVCRQLNKLRKGGFLHSLCSVETTEDGTNLDFEQVLDAVKEFWGFEFESDNSDDMQASFKEQLNIATQNFVEEKLDVSDFVRELGQLAEDMVWNDFARQQAVKAEYHLNVDIFLEFRVEILHLDRVFKSVDIDHSGHLDKDECARLLKELGLVPKTVRCKEEMMEQLNLNDAEGVDFQSFLRLVHKSRMFLEAKLYQNLKNVYPPWATNEKVTVTASFLSNPILKDVNIQPRCRKELRIVSRVIRENNADGDNRYDLSEVMHICGKAEEQLRQMRIKLETEAARVIGITEAELNQARWAFEQLDMDCSGALDKVEAKKAMGLVGGTTFSNKHFAMAFERLDKDKSGSLEIPEFLQLIHTMKDASHFENDEDGMEDDMLGAKSPLHRKPSMLFRASTAFESANFGGSTSSVQ